MKQMNKQDYKQMIQAGSIIAFSEKEFWEMYPDGIGCDFSIFKCEDVDDTEIAKEMIREAVETLTKLKEKYDQ